MLTAMQQSIEDQILQGKDYRLKLSNKDPLKGWLLELFCSDTILGVEIAENFRNTGMWLLRQFKCHHFLQGESSNWILFEFWTQDQSVILEASMALADECKLDLEIGELRNGRD